MTFSYSGNPTGNDTDAVRFFIGDTLGNEPLLQDEEIEFLLVEEGSVSRASVVAAETIAAKFARLADEDVGDVAVKFSQKHEHYLTLAKTLKAKSALSGAIPFAGGISQSDKFSTRSNDDRVIPAFNTTMQENPDADTKPFVTPQNDRFNK